MNSFQNQPELFDAGIFEKAQGTIAFFNQFDFEPVKRMYLQIPRLNAICAWQGHQYEKKWFYCAEGTFDVKIACLDDFVSPSNNTPITSFALNSRKPQVLYIPGGFANGFRATSINSKLVVFSNFDVSASKADDYRFPFNLWNVWD